MFNFMHIFQGSGPAEDAIQHSQDLPQQIAQAGGERRSRNLADAATTDMRRKYTEERRHRQRVTAAASLVAADRLALRRTLSFIEERWRAGAEVDQTFEEAEKVRRKEFDTIVDDYEKTQRLSAAMDDMTTDVNEARKLLVNEAPVRTRSRGTARRPRR